MEPPHPQTGLPLTDIERHLWRLRMAAHEATEVIRGFKQYENAAASINDALWFTISNQCLLIISKFLEVWDDFGGLARADERIVQVRRCAQPLIDRLNLWSGLTNFRNMAGAHAYTDKAGRLVPPWVLLSEGQAPTFHAEIILLLKIVPLATTIALSVFESEFVGIKALCGPGDMPPPNAAPGIERGDEIESALTPIVADVLKKYDDTFGRPVSQAIIDLFSISSQPRDA